MSARRAGQFAWKTVQRVIAEQTHPVQRLTRGQNAAIYTIVRALDRTDYHHLSRRILIIPHYGAYPALLKSQGFCSTPSCFAADHSQAKDGAKGSDKVLTKAEEDYNDSITDQIPEPPVTVVEGASYSVVILLGLGLFAAAAYTVVNELLIEPKEYRVFNKALDRIRTDNQITIRIGSPVKGYGNESRNRAARQRIAHRIWKDERGTEHVEVQFHIKGPDGAGIVQAEMFHTGKEWKFMYLVVQITSPVEANILLESYIPS